MYIKLNYINVFKKCIEKLQYMYIVRHRTTWDHWDLGPCVPILQYGPWAQPLHPKIEPKTYQGYGPRSHITMFCPKPIWHTIVILSHRNM